jgi:lantibiotic modifying enzyme
LDVATALRRQAIHRQDGTATWSLVRREDGRTRELPLGPHLGSGALGVAIFLAALDRVHDLAEHRALCLAAVAALRRDVAALPDGEGATSLHPAPGGMCGLGSLIYGLVTLGRLLEEPDLTADALAVCRHLDAARLREESRLDVMFGLAGLVLSLLVLERALSGAAEARLAVEQGRPLEVAAVCVRRLAELWSDEEETRRATPGYSHGAAGVACALARFARAAGDGAAAAAASSALAAAESGFAAAPPGRASWCNGAAGLHLARLETAAAGAAGPAAPEEVAAVARLEDEGRYDHLCCGGAGRADVLAHAAGKLGAPALLAAARRLGAALLGRQRLAALRFPHPEIVVEPRLLRGPTGVGYAFLRLAAPEKVPCVLAFE